MRLVTGLLALMTFCGIFIGAGHGVAPVISLMVIGAWPASYWLLLLVPGALIVFPSLGKRTVLKRILCGAGYLGLMVVSVVVTRQSEKVFRSQALATALPTLLLSIVGIGMNISQRNPRAERL